MRQAKVLMHGHLAGYLSETDEGYTFVYDANYLNSVDGEAVSLTLPIGKSKYSSRVMFPFFDGLIPEGWLLDIAGANWKINPRDRMGLLMVCCKDTIGAVTIEAD